jgi:hypothetical protein
MDDVAPDPMDDVAPDPMDGVAPDLATAVVGFRQWRLHGSELWALRGTARWRRGVQTARCEEGAHDGPAPAKGCSCGIYALYGPTPRGASAATPDLVAGAVTLWGQIELHAHGMRAQHAMVVALALPFSRGDKRRWVLAAADALEVPAVPARALKASALQHGAMIPRRMRPPDTMPHKRQAPGEPAPARLYLAADGYPGRQAARSSGACRARVIPGHEFMRICSRAIESGWTAPPGEYMAGYGAQDQFAVLPRAFASKAAGDRRVVIAFPCEGISLTKLGQGPDGSRGPIVAASDLLKRECAVVEVSLTDLQHARPAFVRERWFEAFLVERITKHLA